MKPLTLSESLCQALELQATIFGQRWNDLVVGELRQLLRAKMTPAGSSLTNKFDVLLRQSTSGNPLLYRCFRITPYQIRYKSLDTRYLVTVHQREGGDGVMMVWQFNSRKAGMNSVSFLVTPAGFVPQAEKVSTQCEQNLPLLAEAGGELLGHLVSRGLLPPNSVMGQAVEERINAMAAIRSGFKRPQETSEAVPNAGSGK